ncbi:winged helix-turn-helix domain-containing protein [Vulcanisaeta distributa]|uniref:winged helix-turn-helix domain-containing protein n=1 Tax=Vulcanisaeta distributa TaxID=164451 RepID=UPI0006CFBCAD|nr:winged helix-turn-helix domain-containing protein [Vulcanisaeta distributa]
MYRKKPRTRIEIYADILLSLDKMGSCDKLSRLAMMVGVPYDRLIRYLNELKGLGLVRWEPYSGGVYLTRKGLEALINAQNNRDNLVLILSGLVQGVKTIT